MKHVLWRPLAAAAVLSLWACSQMPDDIPDVPEPDVPIPEGFIGIQLKDAEATSTRADDTHREYNDRYEYFEWFNKGTADERAIMDNSANNRVIFFNSDYSYFGSYGLKKPAAVTSTSNIYVARTPLDKDNVAYALVVLNVDENRILALEAQLEALGTDTSAVDFVLSYLFEVDTEEPESLAQAKDGDKKYFTMASTVYRAEDTNEVAVLTPLKGQVFFETEEEAIKSENLTTFYVERVLAKYTLLISDKDGNKRFNEYDARIIVNGANKLKVRQEYAPTDGLAKDVMTDWKINVVNWGLNGLEKNTYLVKRLLEPADDKKYPWTINGNFFTGWNSPELYRAYWSVDENYSDGKYPDQYRQALDVDGVKAATENNIYSDGYTAEDGLTRGDYTLIYKPYEAYKDLTENKYSLENTFDPKIISEQDIKTKPWLRCGTHIIMTAQFIIDEIDKGIDLKGSQPGFIPGVKDKYFSNGMYWSEKALKEQAVATLMTNIYYNKKGDENRIKNVIGEGTVEFINTEEHTLDDDAPISASIGDGEPVVLKHEDLAENAEKYFEFAPAFIKGGDGWVTLKKKDDVKLYARYVEKATGNITEKELSEEQIVSYIYRFTNLAKHYKEGRMYYALPVRHNLESVSFRNDPVTDVRMGDYGAVRNTWYRLTITSIQVPGTPVDDPDQPIIPNPEPDDKSLGVEVEVIPWRTVQIEVDQLH